MRGDLGPRIADADEVGDSGLDKQGHDCFNSGDGRSPVIVRQPCQIIEGRSGEYFERKPLAVCGSFEPNGLVGSRGPAPPDGSFRGGPHPRGFALFGCGCGGLESKSRSRDMMGQDGCHGEIVLTRNVNKGCVHLDLNVGGP